MRRIFRLCLSALLLITPVLLWAEASAAPFAPPKKARNASGTAQTRDLETLLRDIAGQRAEVIAIQRELVSRPALGPEAGGEGEEPKAHWLLTLFKEKGITDVERLDSVERIQSLDPRATSRNVRPNIIVRHAGARGGKGRTLWIVCHMHVAAPGPLEQWNGSPWTLRVEGDTLYGRGVMDNYQSITAALILFESLVKNKIRPPLNLGLVLHSQNSGFRHVLETRPDLFRPGDLILVPDYGNAQGSVMGIAEKGLLWLKVTVTGAQSHAAAGPATLSALMAGSRLVTMLPALAETFPARDPLFAVPSSVFAPTRAATSETGVNAVAAAYTVYLDCRFVRPYSPDDVEAGVRRLADTLERENGVSVLLDRLLAWPSPPATSVQSPVARVLARAVTAQLPQVRELKAEGAGVITAATFLRAKGLPAVTWAKIAPDNRQIANEYALISDHLDEARVFARMLFDLDAAASPPKGGEQGTR